jgi:Transglycosylase SLT domain
MRHLGLAVLLCVSRVAIAAPFPAPAAATTGCEPAIAHAEATWHLPDGILDAIARVESGRSGGDGSTHPWPWTITAEGNGQYFASAGEAIAAVQKLQAQGIRSIDVGCLQVNLMHHPEAFATLQEAFDPEHNADYAASFLTTLRGQLGSWPAAIGAYHSMTPSLADPYRERVLAAWHGAPLFTTSPGMSRPFAMGFNPLPARPVLASHGVTGRDLAAYRAAPVRLALRR